MLNPVIRKSSLSVLLILFCTIPLTANAIVTAVEGGYKVDYYVSLAQGTSNGSDIEDSLIFEWNQGGDFSADFGPTISGEGNTYISHVIDFEPDSALILGWGAAIPGVGDEKDHLFMLASDAFTKQVTGLNWSVAFPGVPPEPRTGHNAMINLLKDAAGGDGSALDAISLWLEREASHAAFNPSGNFRVIEWSVAQPIDVTTPIPVLSGIGLAALVLVLLMFAWKNRNSLIVSRN